MNVVDSSAWLEYFANGPNAGSFAKPIEDSRRLIVPTLGIYEVFKRVLSQRDEDAALQAIGVMHRGTVVDLDSSLAMAAARISIQSKLPMADSVMLATSRAFGATLWTQDEDFRDLPGVQFRARKG
jgi:predicted nucleic acid-binding protein